MNILEVKDLHKSFGSKTVLDGLTFSVSEGSVFGFIGRNGAGKTTTMKMILGLLQADSGEITVCGERVRYGNTPTNKYVGCLPDVPEFYSYMTAREYLRLCGEVTGMKQSEIKKRSGSDVQIVPASAGDAEKTAQLLGGEVHSGTVIVKNASQDKMLIILKTISENRIPILKIEHTEPDLEQLFMEVIGK